MSLRTSRRKRKTCMNLKIMQERLSEKKIESIQQSKNGGQPKYACMKESSISDIVESFGESDSGMESNSLTWVC